MTLRDLTKRQLYNLRRRCDKIFKQWTKRWQPTADYTIQNAFRAGYNSGLKDGLELIGDGIYGPKYIHSDQIKK